MKREAIRQWSQIVTVKFVKIIGESRHSWPQLLSTTITRLFFIYIYIYKYILSWYKDGYLRGPLQKLFHRIVSYWMSYLGGTGTRADLWCPGGWLSQHCDCIHINLVIWLVLQSIFFITPSNISWWVDYVGMISISWSRRRWASSLQWCHNERGGVSNHRRLGCLLNLFVQPQNKENIKATRYWALWGEFTSDR